MSLLSSSAGRSIPLALALGVALSITAMSSAEAQPKGAKPPAINSRAQLEATTPTSPNPYVSFLPVGVKPDYHYWNAKMRLDAVDRAAKQKQRSSKVAVTNEASRGLGNDSIATATPANFTPGTLDNVSGMSDAPATPSGSTAVNPGDTIGTATAVAGLVNAGAVSYTAEIGLGPHGSGGSGNGDFDVYAVTLAPGDSLTVDLNTVNPSGPLDPIVAVFDSPIVGTEFIASFNDDDPFDPALNFDSFLQFNAYDSRTFYVVVGGFLTAAPADQRFPTDLNTSGSGPGAGSEGPYEIVFGRNSGVDYWSLDVNAGDVIGAASDVAVELSILSPTGGFIDEGQGSNFLASGLLPPGSPLPSGTGSEVSNVARISGTHYIRVRTTTTTMSYVVDFGVFKPPSQTLPQPSELFVDFDGASVNAVALFGQGNNPAVLSPLSSFLAGWGFAPADENALIDAILASITETILSALVDSSPHGALILTNSRDYGGPLTANASTLVVGGTIAQLGIGTIGIASAIDTGNFGLNDTGVILLDLLSDAGAGPNSLNQFGFLPATTAGKIAMVAEGVANISVHEAGHFWGNWHTEQFNPFAVIQDQGGNLANSVGVGPDNTWGTMDDVDVDFGFDVFNFNEGSWGLEDQAGRTGFGLAWGVIFGDGFESGDLSGWSSSSP